MSFLRGATLTLGSSGQPFLPINIRGTSGRKVMVNGIIPSDGGTLPPDPEFNSVTITGSDTGSSTALKVVSGSVSAINANITDNISASKINVDNVADPQDSHVRCYSYEFRQESEVDGWNVSQLRPSVPPTTLDDMLIFSPAVSGAIVGVIPSDFNPNVSDIPNIILDPQTQALGGRIQCSGIVKCPKIAFGTESNESQHWTVREDPPGNPESDNLVFRAPGSTSIFKILNNSDATLLQQNNTQLNLNTNVILNSSSSLSFGSYSFRPQQFYKDITTFSFNNSAIGSTNLLFNTGNPANQEWTNVNTGVANQPISLILNPGAYKLTIRQTSGGALNEILGMYVMSDIVLSRPNDNAPTIELAQPTAYSYTQYNGVSGGANPGSPIITMIPGFLTWAVHCTFPNTTGNETASIRVTLTQMPYF